MNYVKDTNIDAIKKHLETQINNIRYKIINSVSRGNDILHIFINKSKQSTGYITFRNNSNVILSKGSHIIIYYLTDTGIEKVYGPILNTEEHLDDLFMLLCNDINCYVTQYIDTIYRYIEDNKINNYLVYY